MTSPPRAARSAPLYLSLVLALVACKKGNEAPPASSSAAATAAPAALPPPLPGGERLSFGPATGSSVEFIGRKITGQHLGHFERFTGTIDLDPTALEKSRVHVEIDMPSVKVEPDGLLKHLKSADFFDVEKFPRATFVTTAVKADNVTGDLNLHGETRAISFPAKVTVAADAVTATAEFSLNRKDFKIVYPGAPDDLIRDDVTIKLNLKAPRK